MKSFSGILTVLMIILSLGLQAQEETNIEYREKGEKVFFDASGRGLFELGSLSEDDTLNQDRFNNGQTVVDVGISILPSEQFNILGVLRFESNLVDNLSTSVRKILLKGVFDYENGSQFSYRVGDFGYQLSPYTLYNDEEEFYFKYDKSVNKLMDVNRYENFINGNSWRLQGFNLNYVKDIGEAGKQFYTDLVYAKNYSALSPRYYKYRPDMIFTSGVIGLVSDSTYGVNANVVNLMGLKGVTITDYIPQNTVGSVAIEYNLFKGEGKYNITLEGGASMLSFDNYNPEVETKKDYFFDLSLNADKIVHSNVMFSVNYRNVGPRFYSAGAQSKRVNYLNSPAIFPNEINTNNIRQNYLIDFYSSSSIYNNTFSEQLMSYDPAMCNAEPYGKATPNRSSYELTVDYGNDNQTVFADARIMTSQEIKAVGTENKKTFMVAEVNVNFNLHKMMDWGKEVSISGGLKYEHVSLPAAEIDSFNVDLTNILANVSTEIEVFRKVYLVGSYISMTNTGNDLHYQINEFNEVQYPTSMDEIRVQRDETQAMIVSGLKYKFSKFASGSVQYRKFTFNNNLNDSKYDMNYFFVLFNVNI